MNSKIFFIFIALFNYNVSQSNNFSLTIGNSQNLFNQQKALSKKYFSLSAKQKNIISELVRITLLSFVLYYIYGEIKREKIINQLTFIDPIPDYGIIFENFSTDNLKTMLVNRITQRKNLFIEMKKIEEGNAYKYNPAQDLHLSQYSILSLKIKVNKKITERNAIVFCIKKISEEVISENDSIIQLHDMLKQKQKDLPNLKTELENNTKKNIEYINQAHQELDVLKQQMEEQTFKELEKLKNKIYKIPSEDINKIEEIIQAIKAKDGDFDDKNARYRLQSITNKITQLITDTKIDFYFFPIAQKDFEEIPFLFRGYGFFKNNKAFFDSAVNSIKNDKDIISNNEKIYFQTIQSINSIEDLKSTKRKIDMLITDHLNDIQMINTFTKKIIENCNEAKNNIKNQYTGLLSDLKNYYNKLSETTNIAQSRHSLWVNRCKTIEIGLCYYDPDQIEPMNIQELQKKYDELITERQNLFEQAKKLYQYFDLNFLLPLIDNESINSLSCIIDQLRQRKDLVEELIKITNKKYSSDEIQNFGLSFFSIDNLKELIKTEKEKIQSIVIPF